MGECEKAFKILDGKCEVIDTYETHPWIAANARNKKVHHAFTIGNNLVYYPILGPGARKFTVAEIRKAPGIICTKVFFQGFVLILYIISR